MADNIPHNVPNNVSSDQYPQYKGEKNPPEYVASADEHAGVDTKTAVVLSVVIGGGLDLIFYVVSDTYGSHGQPHKQDLFRYFCIAMTLTAMAFHLGNVLPHWKTIWFMYVASCILMGKFIYEISGEAVSLSTPNPIVRLIWPITVTLIALVLCGIAVSAWCGLRSSPIRVDTPPETPTTSPATAIAPPQQKRKWEIKRKFLVIRLGDNDIKFTLPPDANGNLEKWSPIAPISSSPVFISASNWKINAELCLCDGRHGAWMRDGNLIDPPAGWDMNQNDEAVEVVNEFGKPVAQIVAINDSDLTLRGSFSVDGKKFLLLDARANVVEGYNASLVPSKALFKYPSTRFDGVRTDAPLVSPEKVSSDDLKLEMFLRNIPGMTFRMERPIDKEDIAPNTQPTSVKKPSDSPSPPQ